MYLPDPLCKCSSPLLQTTLPCEIVVSTLPCLAWQKMYKTTAIKPAESVP